MSNTAGETFIDRIYVRAIEIVVSDPKNDDLTDAEVREAIERKFLELVDVLNQVIPPHIAQRAIGEFLHAHGHDVGPGRG